MTCLAIKPPYIVNGLHAEVRAGRKYELMADFVYCSAVAGVGTIRIQTGYIFNGHSVPRLLWPIFPPDDWLESAAAHDFLYDKAEVTDADGTRAIERWQADAVHREVILHCASTLPEKKRESARRRAGVMYVGLRIGGWKAWRDYRQGKVKHS